MNKPIIPLELALQMQIGNNVWDIPTNQIVAIMGREFPAELLERVQYFAELRARLRFIEAEAMLRVAAEYAGDPEPDQKPGLDPLTLDAQLAALAGLGTFAETPRDIAHHAIETGRLFAETIRGHHGKA